MGNKGSLRKGDCGEAGIPHLNSCARTCSDALGEIFNQCPFHRVHETVSASQC